MPAKDAPGMRAACLRETAVKMNRRRVVVRAVLKMHVSSALPNEWEIILDNLFVLD